MASSFGATHLFDSDCPWAYDLYKREQNNHWVPEETSMSKDVAMWNTEGKLTEAEKHLIEFSIGFFAPAETILMNSISGVERNVLKDQAIRHYLTRQAMSEAIHADTFVYICESLGIDVQRVKALADLPCVEAKNAFFEKWAGPMSEIDRDLFEELPQDPGYSDKQTQSIMRVNFIIAEACKTMCLEGLFFYGGFAQLLSLKRRNKMIGIGEQYSYILRDEVLHVEFGMQVLAYLKKQWPEEYTQAQQTFEPMVEEAIKLEQDFCDEALPTGIPTMPNSKLKKYVHYMGMLQFSRLTSRAVNLTNPFPWMDEYDGTAVEQNFFETKVTEYQSAANLEW